MTLVLHSVRPALTFSETQVYFAFGSGRFRYDCVTCGAKCCRGYGYALSTGREVQHQIALNPAVRFFMTPVGDRGRERYQMGNCPPGCFFLSPAGLCGVQQQYGYDGKPETCRLFPFNHIRLAGKHLIVLPHPNLCPLEITAPGETGDESSHASLYAQMAAQGLHLEVQPVTAINGDPVALVALERQITALAEECLDDVRYEDFVRRQIEVTSAAFAGAGTAGTGLDASGDDLRSFAATWCRVLGDAPSPAHREHARLVRTLVAGTPAVRAHLVFHGRDSGAIRYLTLDRVPHLLAALHRLMGLAHEAGMEDITYQTLMRLFTQNVSMLIALAHLDSAMQWAAGTPIDLAVAEDHRFQSAYIRIARRLLPAAQRRRPVTLGELLCDEIESTDERFFFLKTVAPRFVSRLIPVSAVPVRRRPRSLRAAMQRWVLRHGNDHLLLAAAGFQQKQAASV